MIIDGENRNAHLAITPWTVAKLSEEDLDMYGLSDRPHLELLVPFTTAHFSGWLAADSDGAVLVWNDFVINQWVEKFSSTAIALMRLACLLDGWERDGWFIHDELEFAREALAFTHKEAHVDPVQRPSAVVQ